MKRTMLILALALLAGCAAPPALLEDGANAPPSAAPLAGSGNDNTAATSTAAAPVVEVDLAAAGGPEVVCTPVTRPGTRMVVGENCSSPRSGRGVSVQTREDIQREISGQGWASGWKTQDQIDAERRLAIPQ